MESVKNAIQPEASDCSISTVSRHVNDPRGYLYGAIMANGKLPAALVKLFALRIELNRHENGHHRGRRW